MSAAEETYGPEHDGSPVGTRRFGRVMRAVVEALQAHERIGGVDHRYGYGRRDCFGLTIAELTEAVFATTEPTESQRRSVLRAVKQLDEAEVVWKSHIGIGGRQVELITHDGETFVDEYVGPFHPPTWGIEVSLRAKPQPGAIAKMRARRGLPPLPEGAR